MKVLKGYKIELDPNNAQRTLFLKAAGVARFAYNWGLNARNDIYQTMKGYPSFIDLNNELNAIKKKEFPWMYEVSKWVPVEAVLNLGIAFDRFFHNLELKKQGKLKGKAGFPQFKTKKNGVGSFTLREDIRIKHNKIKLPRIGWVRLKEHGYIPISGVRILFATVSEHAGHWFVSVQVEENVLKPELKKDEHSTIGVDLGIKTLAVCSDGQVFENPRALKKRLRKLKRLQRSVSRKRKGGRNRKKAVKKLARLHYKVFNIRRDTLHKISTHLTKTKSVIGIEDLNVVGMMKNHCLAQAIGDLGLGEWRRQMEYKGKLYGCKIIMVDRFFPSSKTCSVCGYVNNDLTLDDREWDCPDCRTHHNRDFNASVNLEKKAEKGEGKELGVAAGSTETKNACEGRGPLARLRRRAKTAPVQQESSREGS